MRTAMITASLVCLASNALAADGYTYQPNGLTILGGLPHPINFEYSRRISDRTTLAIALGALPRDLVLNPKVGLNIPNLEAKWKWHPFSGAFFLGLGSGWHQIRVTGNENFTTNGVTIPTTVNLGINALYVIPQLGWTWVTSSGFTFGLEGGYMKPFSAWTTGNITSTDPQINSLYSAIQGLPEYRLLQDSLNQYGSIYGYIAFPYAAIRLGWSF